MEREKMLQELTEIFKEVMGNGNIILKYDDSPKTIEIWDSLTHIILVMALEEKYDCKFSAKTILEWKNIGDIIDSILAIK